MRARAYRLLVIKMLTPAVRLPKCTGYCGFFEHRSRKRSAVRENFLSPNTFFLFSSYNIELMKTCLSSLFFFPSRKKENKLERAIYSLLLENLEMIQGSRSRCVRYVNIRDVEKSHWRFTGHVVLNKYKGRELDRFHVGIIVIDLLLAPRRLRNKMFFLLTFPHLASHLFFSQTLSKIPDLRLKFDIRRAWNGFDSIKSFDNVSTQLRSRIE